jgi:hypothetical protein
VKAVLITLAGDIEVTICPMRCGVRDCRIRHMPNYMWSGDKKINTVKLSQVEALFVSLHIGFSKSVLEYNEALQYRGFLSAKAICWAAKDALLSYDIRPHHLHELYEDARFLFATMQEFESLPQRHVYSIEIGKELSENSLQAYDKWCHRVAFVKTPTNVTATVGDGHETAMVRLECGEEPGARVGRPPKDRRRKRFRNGRFLVVDDISGRIFAVNQMREPKNNKIVFETCEKTLPQHKNTDLLICDKACKFEKQGRKRAGLDQIKTYCVDKLHAKRESQC